MLRLNNCAPGGKAIHMSDEKSNNPSREERLAAKLRENLRRRKAQSRQMGESEAQDLPKTGEPS